MAFHSETALPVQSVPTKEKLRQTHNTFSMRNGSIKDDIRDMNALVVADKLKRSKIETERGRKGYL